MASRRNLSTGLAAVVTASAAALGCCPSAAADPASPPPQPNAAQQLPGLQALAQLSPLLQQVAGNPAQATQLLMAAAQAFSHNPTAPSESKSVATAVDQFVQPHVPPPDLVPGAEAHLAPGINPVFAAGPGPAAAPSATPPTATPPSATPPVSATAPGTVQPVTAAAALPASAALPAPAPAAGPATAPVPHVPPPDLVPGAEAHLAPGINPVYAAGPGPAPAPEPPVAAPAPVTVQAVSAPAISPPAPAPAAAHPPAPAPNAAPGPAPGFGPDTPPTQDFMYPSIGTNCLADGSSSIATALSVAGPAKIPLPGPGPGQTAYVFTAIGTPGPAEVQKLPLNITWVNLTTGKSGTATLKPRADINANGPSTLTAIVDTGSGSIMSTIFGQVTTKEKQCQFMPTIGSTVVP